MDNEEACKCNAELKIEVARLKSLLAVIMQQADIATIYASDGCLLHQLQTVDVSASTSYEINLVVRTMRARRSSETSPEYILISKGFELTQDDFSRICGGIRRRRMYDTAGIVAKIRVPQNCELYVLQLINGVATQIDPIEAGIEVVVTGKDAVMGHAEACGTSQPKDRWSTLKARIEKELGRITTRYAELLTHLCNASSSALLHAQGCHQKDLGDPLDETLTYAGKVKLAHVAFSTLQDVLSWMDDKQGKA